MRLSVFILTILVVAAAPAPAPAFSEQVLESVVSVLPDWRGDLPGGAHPEGTAIAVLPGGYLATNGHVLGNAETLRIRLNDGRLIEASIIARDAATDIALIKAPLALPVLPPAPMPRLAQPVCAIGNQFGLGLSVTCGVVSAIHRTGTGFNDIEDFVQTDATINPGGSGGALVDGEGRLIGMVSAIFTKNSDADIGVNFAAATELVMRVVSDLKDHGRVVRGSLGFQAGNLTKAEQAATVGVRVRKVERNGPAFSAGIEAGDMIQQVGRRAVRRTADLTSALALFRPGERVPLRLDRDGSERFVEVIMVAQK